MPELMKSDGGVIHYELHGPADAPTIVLIEGLSGHMLAWRGDFFAPFLDAGFAVVRFDNRDVGLSQHYPNQRYELRDMARDVHELIAHLRIAPVHLVAQSMGGMIAQHLMLRNPEDVASSTLFYTAASSAHVLGNARSVETLDHAPRPASRDEAVEQYVEQERLCASTAFPFDEEWKRELGGLMWDRDHDRGGRCATGARPFRPPRGPHGSEVGRRSNASHPWHQRPPAVPRRLGRVARRDSGLRPVAHRRHGP